MISDLIPGFAHTWWPTEKDQDWNYDNQDTVLTGMVC